MDTGVRVEPPNDSEPPMPALPDPEPGYTWARLQGGPVDGQMILAPVEPHRSDLPTTMIGVLALVLDEAAETFTWERVRYVWRTSQRVPRPGEPWVYVAEQR
jgi:hypothetical protein